VTEASPSIMGSIRRLHLDRLIGQMIERAAAEGRTGRERPQKERFQAVVVEGIQ
jgi:hypothetical protein